MFKQIKEQLWFLRPDGPPRVLWETAQVFFLMRLLAYVHSCVGTEHTMVLTSSSHG